MKIYSILILVWVTRMGNYFMVFWQNVDPCVVRLIKIITHWLVLCVPNKNCLYSVIKVKVYSMVKGKPSELWGPSWSWLYGSRLYNYLCNQCLSPLTLWVPISLRRGVPNTTLYDKVCQWLATGRCFSQGTTVSSTNKTDSHDRHYCNCNKNVDI